MFVWFQVYALHSASIQMGPRFREDDYRRGYAALAVGFQTCPIEIFSSFLRPP